MLVEPVLDVHAEVQHADRLPQLPTQGQLDRPITTETFRRLQPLNKTLAYAPSVRGERLIALASSARARCSQYVDGAIASTSEIGLPR